MKLSITFLPLVYLFWDTAADATSTNIFGIRNKKIQQSYKHRYLRKNCGIDVSNDAVDSNDGRETYYNIFSHSQRRTKVRKGGYYGRTCAPTTSPTKAPSASPTAGPTRTDTLSPSISLAPSDVDIPYLMDGPTYRCKDSPPTSGITESQVIPFKYNLYTAPEANTSTAVEFVETLLYAKMAKDVLTCDYDNDADFHVLLIGNHSQAVISNDECDTTDDLVPSVDTECIVVLSEVNIKAHFPYIDSFEDANDNPEVRNAAADYLNFTMTHEDFITGEVVQISFQGFWSSQNSTAAGATVAYARAVGSSDDVFGTIMIAAAAICLFVLAFFAVQRKRQQRRALIKHLEEMDGSNGALTFDHKNEPGVESPSSEGKVQLVLCEHLGLDDLSTSSDELFQRENRNVHHCNSATCPVCTLRPANPTFLPRTEEGALFQFHTSPETMESRESNSFDNINL